MSEEKDPINTDDETLDDEVRKLVVARLIRLSPDTVISIGNEGNYTRAEMIENVEKENDAGKKIIEIQLAWMRQFKENAKV